MLRSDRQASVESYAFAAELVDHCEHSKKPAVGQLVCWEINRPPLVDARRRVELHARPGGNLPVLSGPYLKSFLGVQPVGYLVVDSPTLAAMQNVQTPVPELRLRGGKLLQTHPKSCPRILAAAVAIAQPRPPQQRAHATSREQALLLGPVDDLPSPLGL